MNPTRTGKIARLPLHVREDIGRALEAGDSGRETVEWLNILPEVQAVLAKYFSGRAITEKNLSEWRAGGHQAWLAQRRAELFISQLAEQSQGLTLAAGGREISDRLANIFSAEMIEISTQFVEQETDPEKRWQLLCQIQRELGHLRHHDHRGRRTGTVPSEMGPGSASGGGRRCSRRRTGGTTPGT